jgi:uncharacterized protein
VVLDEAHNFVPAEAHDPLRMALAEEVLQIAAEGRKFGLFLVAATQRPGKVAPGLLAECENVCLLRLQSPVDLQVAYDTWRIPHEVLGRVPWFNTGDGVMSGRWAGTPTFFHAGPRRTAQGGASLDPGRWGQPRRAVFEVLRSWESRSDDP